MPEWMTTLDLSDLKLLVFFVLIGTVLFVSRDRGQERAEGVLAMAVDLSGPEATVPDDDGATSGEDHLR